MRLAPAAHLLRTAFIVATMASPLALSGCIVVARNSSSPLGMAGRPTLTRIITVAHIDNKPLDVETQNGTVEVINFDGDQVVITAEIRARSLERAQDVMIEAVRRPDGTLAVRVGWPNDRRSREGVSLRIQVPNFSSQTTTTSTN